MVEQKRGLLLALRVFVRAREGNSSMKHKTVPAIPGVQFSAIGLGCWSLGAGSRWEGSSDARSIATVRRAIAEGVNFIDTAPVYGFGELERLLGEALQGNRDRVFLASKCGSSHGTTRGPSRDRSPRRLCVRTSRASLRRLRTDHLDLLQLHWPDHDTPLEETARALEVFFAPARRARRRYKLLGRRRRGALANGSDRLLPGAL